MRRLSKEELQARVANQGVDGLIEVGGKQRLEGVNELLKEKLDLVSGTNEKLWELTEQLKMAWAAEKEEHSLSKGAVITLLIMGGFIGIALGMAIDNSIMLPMLWK